MLEEESQLPPLPLTTDFPPLKPIFQQARRKAKIPHFVNSKAKGFLDYQKTRGFRIKHEKLPLPPYAGTCLSSMPYSLLPNFCEIARGKIV